jgi:hypothetical protein
MEKAPDVNDRDTNLWPNVPLPAELSPQQIVWHYTDAAGLIGILSSHRLWATHSSYLNDSTEYEYGLRVIRDALADMTPDASPFVYDRVTSIVGTHDPEAALLGGVYVISASSDGDLLNQWAHYAKGAGYAVGLKCDTLLVPYVLGDPELPGRPQLEPPIWRNFVRPAWRRVIYKPAEQKDLARRLLTRIVDEWTRWEENIDRGDYLFHKRLTQETTSLLTITAPHFKHPAFSPEQEVRYVATTLEDSPPIERYRAVASGIVRYIAVGASAADIAPNAILPIQKVVCGPLMAEPAGVVAVQRLLQAQGYPYEVEKSGVPFRGSRQ